MELKTKVRLASFIVNELLIVAMFVLGDMYGLYGFIIACTIALAIMIIFARYLSSIAKRADH